MPPALNPSRLLILTTALSSLGACGSPESGPQDSDTVDTVGEPCPASNLLPQFSGNSPGEVEIGTGHPECGAGVCLVNHTQGRIACPYGQTEEQLSLPEDHPDRCRTPDGENVTTLVSPQLEERRADENIYCSCQCDGPDTAEQFCECPTGFICHDLVKPVGKSTEHVGSYCVRAGTIYDPAASPSPECDRDLQNCE